MAKKQIDWVKLDTILQFYPTKATCCDQLGVSEDVLEKRLRVEKNCTFREYRETKMSGTRVALARKAVKMALDGNVTMLIFCLKNLCGWTDQHFQNTSQSQQVIQLKYSVDEPKK